MQLMHIAWTDLNNVQEAGDYPFRDGRITMQAMFPSIRYLRRPRAGIIDTSAGWF
jgi:hypothetical protein